MNHGSLFSGIGGFDLAVDWMGWNNSFHCELNPFAQRILKYYWPNAISYDDIKKTDFTIHRGSIDILTGGFPCQPYSVSGKRKGKNDDRHLWPEMFRAIREIQPPWIVGENVRGIASWNGGLVFDEVQADLETEGYEVTPFLLPACAVNAPHRRERIWFIAYSVSFGGSLSVQQRRQDKTKNVNSGWKDESRVTPHTNDKWRLQGGIFGGRKNCESIKEVGNDFRNHTRSVNEGKSFTNTNSKRIPRSEIIGGFGKSRTERDKQFSRHICTDWKEFPTESPVCNRDDGLSSRLDGITFSKWRKESIKGGGNAIVPQVALQIFKAIESL